MALSSIDISIAISNSNAFFFVDKLKGGRPCKRSATVYFSGNGSYAIAYKYELPDGTIKALRIWTKDEIIIKPILEQSKEVSKELVKLQSDYFVGYEYYHDAILISGKRYPVLLMDWCDGVSLKQYISNNLTNKNLLKQLADNFLKMFCFLHEKQISHGDLQHGNIMIEEGGQIKLLDYDSLYFPTPYFKNRREVLYGYDAYQHPCRKKNQWMGPKVDYFSELILYISILAVSEDSSLWTDYNVMASETRFLFSESDFGDITHSLLFKKLSKLPYPIPQLLDVLKVYLNERDILNLRPFYTYFDLKNCSIYCINCGSKMGYGDCFCYNCGCKLIYN